MHLNCKDRLAATALLAVAWLAAAPLPAHAAILAVSAADGALVITGQSFGTAQKPVVTLGATGLAVTSFKADSITATLPVQATTGSYALTLRTFSSASHSSTETFDVTLGAVGPAGPAGAAGQSVLSVQLATGSAACPNGGSEFLAASGYTTACNGSDGAPEPAGPQGAIGPEGAMGPQGQVGPQGPEGPRGATGPQGAAGPQGAQGEAGHGAYWADQAGRFVGVSSTLFPYITWSDSEGILWGLNPEQVAIGGWKPTAGGIYSSGTLQYFDTPDCSGAAYVQAMPPMTSAYYLSTYWYRPPTAQARLFAPVAFRNWYTGQACTATSAGSAFYLDASLLVPMRPQAEVIAELQAQGFVPPFRMVIR
jgi:hypothetical protein